MSEKYLIPIPRKPFKRGNIKKQIFKDITKPFRIFCK